MTKPSHTFTVSSRVAAVPDVVWTHALTLRGVNQELFPLARMTCPRGIANLDVSRESLGKRQFRSWILAACLLPIDFDDITFVELGPGRFLERSPMLSQKLWEHERRVEAVHGGSLVTDRVTFTPKLGFLGPLMRVIYLLTFRLRHRNLRRIFGAA
jgi:ligand-binding SRPBCC domain-containing protein